MIFKFDSVNRMLRVRAIRSSHIVIESNNLQLNVQFDAWVEHYHANNMISGNKFWPNSVISHFLVGPSMVFAIKLAL